MSLVQSKKNDARMMKESNPDVQIDVSEEETLSEVETKLKQYKTKVKEYEYKLKRLKTLEKEEKEKELVLNIRKPIDLKNTVKKKEKLNEGKIGRDAHRTNDTFQGIQEAKEIISTNNNSSSDKDNLKTGDSLKKWQKLNTWNITDEDLEKQDYDTKVDNTPKPKFFSSKDKVENIDIVSNDLESEDEFLEDIKESNTQGTKVSQESYEGFLKKPRKSIPNQVSTLKSKLNTKSSSNLTKEERILIRRALNKMSDEEEDELIDITGNEYEDEVNVHGEGTQMKSKSPKRLRFNNKKEVIRYAQDNVKEKTLKTKFHNLPPITDDNSVLSEEEEAEKQTEEERQDEEELEPEEETEEDEPEEDNYSKYQYESSDNEKMSSKTKIRQKSLVDVNEDGDLIIPKYMQSNVLSHDRPPLTNWSREMDYKLCHLLKQMSMKDFNTGRWRAVAAQMEEHKVSSEDIRIHVRVKFTVI